MRQKGETVKNILIVDDEPVNLDAGCPERNPYESDTPRYMDADMDGFGVCGEIRKISAVPCRTREITNRKFSAHSFFL